MSNGFNKIEFRGNFAAVFGNNQKVTRKKNSFIEKLNDEETPIEPEEPVETEPEEETPEEGGVE